MLLLHDGRVLMLGGRGKNAFYTPNSDGTGTWALTQDTPAGYHSADAPAIVEPNGKVLVVVSNDPVGSGGSPAHFYEFDPYQSDTTLMWSQEIAPPPADPNDQYAWNMTTTAIRLLALPNGQILVGSQDSTHAWLFNPDGAPQDSWRPSPGRLLPPSFGVFEMTGVQLSGLTTGGDYGDDAKTNTNFPIVSAWDGAGNVWYGTSMSFSDLTPRFQAGHFYFTLPNSMPDGSYTLRVAANGVLDNGINSAMNVTFSGPHVIGFDIEGSPRVPAGQTATGTITLAAPAPAGGANVYVTSSNPNVAGVPVSITIPAGSTSGPVTIYGYGAEGSTLLQASSFQNQRFVASKTFGWSLTSVGGPMTVDTNMTATWYVDLDGAAPADGTGIVVSLQSSNPAFLAVPSTVTVPPGYAFATFPINVLAQTAGKGIITASLPGSTKSATFATSGWSVASVSGPAVADAGTTVEWTVSVTSPAPSSGVVVGLQSSKTSVATVPATVTVPSGQSSATFLVTSVDPTGQTLITGSVGSSSQSGRFGYLLKNSISPTTLQSGQTATGTVTVDPAAPAGGFTITLDSSKPNTLTPSPTSVTIPAGATTATYSAIAGATPSVAFIKAHLGSQVAAASVAVSN
jgi:hypothetical protein